MIRWSCRITWQNKTDLLPLTLSMVNKLNRMLTYLEQLPPIKLLNPLLMWPCKITWQTKIIRSPLPQSQWQPNLPCWRHTVRGYHIVTWQSGGFAISCENLKKFLSPCSQDFLPAIKFGWVVTTVSRSSMQMLKSSPFQKKKYKHKNYLLNHQTWSQSMMKVWFLFLL